MIGHLSSAIAIPTESTSEAAANGSINGTEVSFQDWFDSIPEVIRTYHEDFLKEAYNANHGHQTGEVKSVEARGLTKRVSMYKGKLYALQGWVFSISYYIVELWQGTSWVFPRDTDFEGQNFIADRFATDVRQVIGNGVVSSREIGGGWSWSGNIDVGAGYEFRDVPYSFAYHTCIDAIQGAVDWISPENGVTWEMVDTLGRKIAGFSIYPTAFDNSHAQDNVHAEF